VTTQSVPHSAVVKKDWMYIYIYMCVYARSMCLNVGYMCLVIMRTCALNLEKNLS
jgi:hypothetical protein